MILRQKVNETNVVCITNNIKLTSSPLKVKVKIFKEQDQQKLRCTQIKETSIQGTVSEQFTGQEWLKSASSKMILTIDVKYFRVFSCHFENKFCKNKTHY